MIRKIIRIDEERCNGCGLCATACHEGAIDIINGKAKLVRENFCDGLGDCLPSCPTGAITFEEREAPEYDEAAVKRAQKANRKKAEASPLDSQPSGDTCGCPGAKSEMLCASAEEPSPGFSRPVPRLAQWPCQIKLVPTKALFFEGTKLLIAADCAAYAYASMHEDIMKGRTTIIGCPKLDDIDYSEKLTEIMANNDIKEVTIVRMEVPCCGGLEMASRKALQASGKFIPWQVVTISRDGRILE